MYGDDFLEGMKKLNLVEPTYITKATDYIPQQIALVKTLEDKGYTYVIDDGVYFDTSKFATYADFARLDLDELKEGARVEFNPQKRNPSDFALWKFSPKGEQRDMEWDTPWGKGFPGWHLECSAMAIDKLGDTLDIHTGGIDHIPVHHTNEIAQSEAATGKTFANYWLHNNFLLVDGTKVSKSLGNTYELTDLADKGFTPDDFRMFVLQSHYRTESNFTWDNLQSAKNRLTNLKAMAQMRFQPFLGPLELDFTKAATDITIALQDDLNTPAALTLLSEVANHVESNGIATTQTANFVEFLKHVDDVLGFKFETEQDITDEQKELISKREQARDAKDWAKSDEIRDELSKQNISIRDTQAGSIWSRS
jgi:cysteinyl-tRNA synthetase